VVILYHGTSAGKVARIKKDGLIPRASRGADYASRRVVASWLGDDRDEAVYLVDSKETAVEFADLVAGKGKTAVIKVRIPLGRTIDLEIDPSFYSGLGIKAYQYLGKIPPKWIEDVEIGLKPKKPMRVLNVSSTTRQIVDIKTGKVDNEISI
jgi:hypothetical protein